MTTITTALSRTGSFLQPGPFRRGLLIGFFAMLLVGFAALLGASVAVGMLSSNRAMPGVSVAGVDISGLDRATAEERLRNELPSLATGDLVLTVDGTPVDVPYADLGRGYQLDAMLDTAFAIARSGNAVDDAVARLRTLVHPSDVAPLAARNDASTFDETVASLVASFAQDPVDATVTYDAASGFTAVPAEDGKQLDPDALAAALLAAAQQTDIEAAHVSVATQPIPPTISTQAALQAARAAQRMTADALSLRAGSDVYELESAELVGLVSFNETTGGTLEPVVDLAGLTALLEPLTDEVAQTPRDAAFTWGSTGIIGVIPGTEGRELDVEGSVASVADALEARGHASVQRSAALAVTVTSPALTTATAQAAAGQMVRLPGGTWTTYFVPGEGNYWGKNITIPAVDLDGYVIAPGEWFSFWNGIGPVTLAHGYGYGGAIIGGRSVANGALAGGICSTSTTLFNAAMRAGLEIGARTNHSYYIERYPVGLDATVLKTDTWTTDMTFRNDTAYPLVIRSYTGSGFVRFDVWGVPDGRQTSLSAPVTSNHQTAKETTVLNSSLAPGTSKRVEYMHDGFDAVVTRTVRNASGGVIWTNTWASHYRTVNGITEVGPAPAATPSPSTPPPSPSASPS